MEGKREGGREGGRKKGRKGGRAGEWQMTKRQMRKEGFPVELRHHWTTCNTKNSVLQALPPVCSPPRWLAAGSAAVGDRHQRWPAG